MPFNLAQYAVGEAFSLLAVLSALKLKASEFCMYRLMSVCAKRLCRLCLMFMIKVLQSSARDNILPLKSWI